MSQSAPYPRMTRIQKMNRKRILEAALDVFSAQGFRGATLDQIAEAAGLSKPNLIYYFSGKEEIYLEVLSDLFGHWLEPLRNLNAEGDAIEEVLEYVRHKLEMSQSYPRESRLFANEIIQGSPRIEWFIKGELREEVAKACEKLNAWMEAGKIACLDPLQLIFSIWATTQHYADFSSQISMLYGERYEEEAVFAKAQIHLAALFSKMLRPEGNSRPVEPH